MCQPQRANTMVSYTRNPVRASKTHPVFQPISNSGWLLQAVIAPWKHPVGQLLRHVILRKARRWSDISAADVYNCTVTANSYAMRIQPVPREQSAHPVESKQPVLMGRPAR